MDETTKVIRIVIDSSKAVEGGREAQRALEQIEKQTAATAASVVRMESGLDVAALVAKLTAGAYVVKEFVDRLTGVFKAARDATAGIQDFSEQLGVSTDFVQGSMYAAAQNTVSVEKMGQAFTKASQVIGQAAQGQKDALGFFNDAGVKILDGAGKLRSTQAILQDSAVALLRVEDPAKRVALAMDLFGRSGAQIIPMLGSIAEGADAMAIKAKAAGALIEGDTVVAMAKLKAHSEETAQKWNALVATLGAPIATTALENFNKFLGDIIDKIQRANGSWSQFLANALDASRREGRIGSGPGALRLETAEERVAREQAELQAERERNRNNPAYAGREGLLADEQARLDAADRANRNARQAGYADEEDRARRFALPVVGGDSPGRSNPGVRGAGQSEADRYAKLIAQLDATAASQAKLTEAALKGDVAFQAQTVHADALQKAIEIYGTKIDDTNPKVAELEKRLKAIAEGKAAQAFAVGTTELEKQNVVLEAQLRLMNEAPEVQARELALIKAKQEAEKAGIAVGSAAFEQRRQAIEQGETLRVQAEQMKQANELWLEPLRQGLRNIQTAGADAWETILKTGNFTLQSLGDTMKVTARRMAAEFLALATIRPIMSLAVQAIGPGGLGLVGGNTAAQLGFPGGGGGGGMLSGFNVGGGGGGGGLGGMFSSGGGEGAGWLGRQFAGVGDFFARPIGSFFPSATPAGGFSDVGALLGSGQTGASAGASGIGGLGGISVGQGLGAVAGIGMGAYTLANSKGTGSTIAGIGQMVGGAVSLIPGFGQIAGPLIMIGSSILGGLIGDGGPKIPPQPALQYSWGGFNAVGGGTRYQSAGSTGAGGIGDQLMRLYRSAGLSPVAGQLYGGDLAVGTDHTLNGQQWQDRPYTQIGLVNGQGGYERITYNDSSRNPQQAAELLYASVFNANVLRGGVSGASDSLKTAVRTMSPATPDAVKNVVEMTAAYDRLGKAANPVKDAIDKLGTSFDELSDFATKAGLALEPINAELEKQTKRTAQDFIDSMLDPLAVQMRALEDERKSTLESALYIKEHIEGVYVDMDRIATYYTNKEAALRDQFYQGGVANLEALIKRLTYGDLANASPDTSLAGTKATYSATLAQARAGSATAIAGLAGAAEAYTSTARNYFASSPEYAALIAQIRRDLAETVAVATGGTTTAGGDAANLNQASGELVALVSNLASTVQSQSDQIADLKNMVTVLVAQQRSATANRM